MSGSANKCSCLLDHLPSCNCYHVGIDNSILLSVICSIDHCHILLGISQSSGHRIIEKLNYFRFRLYVCKPKLHELYDWLALYISLYIFSFNRIYSFVYSIVYAFISCIHFYKLLLSRLCSLHFVKSDMLLNYWLLNCVCIAVINLITFTVIFHSILTSLSSLQKSSNLYIAFGIS